MISNAKNSHEYETFSADAIDYQYYERRARCLRSGALLNWLSRWTFNKKYSSRRLCDTSRMLAAGNG